MSNSYRIRTTPGVDKSVKVLIEQEFEYLEILSLKILQSQIYTRNCSDYGVIVGRVSVNDGFGVPNAKVSIFIPITDEDSNNPIISDLYPYKTLSDLNEDGYRYNLLPYRPSHSGHIPTGTFFDREDVLTNPTLIEVYDKYYKYNAVTNESGDYMIFGVPVGSQTIKVDVDLSDIGEFSLSPQDLIRMGVATDSQVSGTKFKSSTNLTELPQIVTINRTLEVEPLWGQPEICNLGITRTDFDLSAEANIDIRPTAIFMGSQISTNDESYQKSNCRPSLNSGELCDLIAGPGEILSIRQTINIDNNGRPILEFFDLEQGGQVIDDNGTWLIDVPMNLDYVITNEFGDRVISLDSKKGIPTKGKYRFKIKWNQSPSLSEPIKRGYFLVPNIKEYGWNQSGSVDPLQDDSVSDVLLNAAKSSYAFSLDWNDYGMTGNTTGLQMIQEAINCEDRFYEMTFNKVYTVSQLITQYRNGYSNTRFISIKNILDDSCRSENNKFPTNDGYYKLDIIYLLFVIFNNLLRPMLYSMVILMHGISFILNFLIIPIIFAFIGYGAFKMYNLTVSAIFVAPAWGLVVPFGAEFLAWLGMVVLFTALSVKAYKIKNKFKNIKIPNLTYPDCEFCECNPPSDSSGTESDDKFNSPSSSNINIPPTNGNGSALLSQIMLPILYYTNIHNNDQQLNSQLSGQQIPPNGGIPSSVGTGCLCNNDDNDISTYTYTYVNNDNDSSQQVWQTYSNDLPIPERLNLFNTKAKYFDDDYNNPGGGVNRIKVTFGVDLNPSKSHLDNVICLLVQPDYKDSLKAGQLISFQDFNKSNDPNYKNQILNDYGSNSITGTSILQSSVVTNVPIYYANPNGLDGNIGPITYQLTGNTKNNDGLTYKFPVDVEYFQVITAMTYSEVVTKSNSSTPNTLYNRVLGHQSRVYRIPRFAGKCNEFEVDSRSYNDFDNYDKQYVVFLVRGVDPNSPRVKSTYDLSVIFGNSFGTNIVSGNFKLNWPIQGTLANVRHNTMGNNYDTDSYTGLKLFYPSFHFLPGDKMSGYTTTLPQYYSSLNNINVGGGGDSNQYVKYNNIFNTSNLKKAENIADYPSTNRGNYYLNERVEGGSYLYFYVKKKGKCTGFYYKMWEGNSSYSCSRYSNSWNINVSTSVTHNNIVMRSDRLPTSTFDFYAGGNYLPLQSNSGFEIFFIDDEGTSSGGPLFVNGTVGGSIDSDNTNPVLKSFNCQGLVPLGCYSFDSDNNKIIVKPDSDDCYTNGTKFDNSVMENGCYVLVTAIFLSLPKDLQLLTEWNVRLNINFAACRNVFSHSFVNNWINGTLFAFSFKNNRYFDKKNQPYSDYCKDTLYIDKKTNNFYYRSSPFNKTNGIFVGQKSPSGGFLGSYGGNLKNLLFPTTIMDLGGRSSYLQDIVFSDEYDGYVVNKLNSTTFSDVSELLNYFLISRIINFSVFQKIANVNVLSFFSRTQKGKFISMVDGDYAQMVSINSEFGVAPFDESSYPADSTFYSGGDSDTGVFGIYFSSNTQNRDWLSPKRTIINDNVNVLNPCAFSSIPQKSQVVPFYQWEIKENPKNLIFGTQKNDWYTRPIDNLSFFSKNYQSMDRLKKESRYFRTKNLSKSIYFNGYIYGVDNSGNLNPEEVYWDKNDGDYQREITVGAPFQFYFGLKKGKSAFDRFTTKWIDSNIIEG